MKKLLPFVFSMLAATALAQAPEAFSYQAVARDAGGDPLANTTVGVQFQLHQTTAVGTVVYAETHSPTTNELGLFSVEVGNGMPTTGTFSAIDWSAGPYFLEVGLDPAGGGSYTIVGIQQLLSVPYALHARTADAAEDDDWVVNGAAMHNDGKQVGIGTAAPVRRLQVEDLLNGATIRPAVKVKTHNCGVPCGQPETTQALSLQNENSTWGNVVGIGFSDNDADETPSAWIGAKLADKAQHHGDLLFHTRDGSGLHQRMMIERTGHVGIGTSAPDTTLHLAGKFKYQDGTQANKRILTSDGVGNASWEDFSAEALFGTGNVPTMGDLSCMTVVDTVSTGASSPWSIAVSGDHAYLADKSSDNLKVFDLSTPWAPVLVATVGTGLQPVSVAVSGDHVYVLNEGSENLMIYDVSLPSSPGLVATIGADLVPSSLAVSGNHAYVVNRSSGTLMVFDVNTPSTPMLVATVGAGVQPISIAVSGGHAYVADLQSNNMMVFDVSTPASPGLVATIGVGTYPAFLTSSGDHVYVINILSDDLFVFDVSTPSSPVLAATIGTGTQPRMVTVSGGYAYVVSQGSHDLMVFDVRIPSSPALVKTAAAGNAPISVAVPGNYAYVGAINELLVFDLFCPTAIGFDMGTGGFSVFSEKDPQVGTIVTDHVPKWDGTALSTGSLFDNGSIGIGTTSPSYKLHVEGGGLLAKNGSRQVTLNHSTATRAIVAQDPSMAYGEPISIVLGTNFSTNNSGYLTFQYNLHTGTNNRMDMGFHNGSAVMSLLASRRVGIGTTSPSSRFHVTGEAFDGDYVARIQNTFPTNTPDTYQRRTLLLQSTSSIYQPIFVDFRNSGGTLMGSIYGNSASTIVYGNTSDRRLKTGFSETGFGLADLLQIEVADYAYQREPDKRITGFIAQQLFEHFPQAVRQGGDDPEEDPWMVDHAGLAPLIVKAIQEQQVIIDDQQQRIEELTHTIREKETENGELKAQVEANTAMLHQLESLMNLITSK